MPKSGLRPNGERVHRPASTWAKIWKESGLAALDVYGEITPDPTTPQYRAAKARYEELRQSPQFMERVKKYER